MEKLPFFWAATAGLGKYRTGGYGRIGVYRVNRASLGQTDIMCIVTLPFLKIHMRHWGPPIKGP